MDYALRERGWLEEFLLKPDVSCYAVEDDGDLIGFTILAKTGEADAEFRIALRADKTGLGLGRNNLSGDENSLHVCNQLKWESLINY